MCLKKYLVLRKVYAMNFLGFILDKEKKMMKIISLGIKEVQKLFLLLVKGI